MMFSESQFDIGNLTETGRVVRCTQGAGCVLKMDGFPPAWAGR